MLIYFIYFLIFSFYYLLGCEYYGYCGDITRTWPANGTFTNYQKILYEIVLEVQKQILKLCGERMSLDYMYLRMINLLGKYLVSEKIIKKDILSSSEINQVNLYY